MTPALEHLVREAMELTGSDKPTLMEDGAPVLADEALSDGDDVGFYLVGLIGGKDVGKSALVNALVGKQITAVTSHGAGTEIVIAYAHKSQESKLRELLEREVAGQYKLVLHDQPGLARQVLLDLPDIDSKYSSHLQVTRSMLRHMLYPIWASSVEKYADLQPQQMLAKVAEGNTPANFVFCLTKADQLGGAEGWAPVRDGEPNTRIEDGGLRIAESKTDPGDASPSSILNPPSSSSTRSDPLRELRDDYAARVQRTLKLENVPRVFLVSARSPEKFDLIALREMVGRQRTDQAIRESKQLAAARQDRALLSWLDGQKLSTRAERLNHLHADAQELVTARIGAPVMDKIIPRLLEDPATRIAMADDILQERVARWPIVNLIHTLLHPLFLLVRSAVSRTAAPLQSADTLVDICVKDSGESIAMLVQAAFAQLRQQQPVVAALYGQNKLWESMPAEFAAGALHRSLAQCVRNQRASARQRLLGDNPAFFATIRWVLTVGALVWFPFVQPVLAAALVDQTGLGFHPQRLIALIVIALGTDYLLRSAIFLLIYYTVVWLALRWNTQRRVARLLGRWKAADYPDPGVNLAAQAMEWMDDLTNPIRAARDRMQTLSQKVDQLKAPAKAA
jgi:hypothetical protein